MNTVDYLHSVRRDLWILRSCFVDFTHAAQSARRGRSARSQTHGADACLNAILGEDRECDPSGEASGRAAVMQHSGNVRLSRPQASLGTQQKQLLLLLAATATLCSGEIRVFIVRV